MNVLKLSEHHAETLSALQHFRSNLPPAICPTESEICLPEAKDAQIRMVRYIDLLGSFTKDCGAGVLLSDDEWHKMLLAIARCAEPWAVEMRARAWDLLAPPSGGIPTNITEVSAEELFLSSAPKLQFHVLAAWFLCL